jgi:hypothetical protein
MAAHEPQIYVATRQCAVEKLCLKYWNEVVSNGSVYRREDGLTAVDRGGGQTQIAWSSETRGEAGSDPKWPRIFTCCAPPHQLRVKAVLEEHKPGRHCSRRYSRHNGRFR